jgi:hypothetical protein
MKQAVATIEHEAPAVQEGNAVIAMIERAARDPNVDIDKMQRLLDMRAAEEARRAKVAYSAALSQMQPELPVITRRGKIGLGGNNQKGPTYAKWEDINEGIKPVLATYGFALSFRTGRDSDKIMVTGILSHKDGHSEETTMLLPIDTGPGRNAVQSVGSSTSYGKRYTASALLNLTSRDEDDDGAGGFITDDQADELRKLITETKADTPKFLRYVGAPSIPDIPASKFDMAKAALESKKKPAVQA